MSKTSNVKCPHPLMQQGTPPQDVEQDHILKFSVFRFRETGAPIHVLTLEPPARFTDLDAVKRMVGIGRYQLKALANEATSGRAHGSVVAVTHFSCDEVSSDKFSMKKLASVLRSDRVSSLVERLQILAHETRPTDKEVSERVVRDFWIHYNFVELAYQVPLIVALGDDHYAIRKLRYMWRHLTMMAWEHEFGGSRLDPGEARATNFEKICQEAVDACAMLVATYPWTSGGGNDL